MLNFPCLVAFHLSLGEVLEADTACVITRTLGNVLGPRPVDINDFVSLSTSVVVFLCLEVQLTLEQPGFERHRLTYMWIFFSKYLYCFGPRLGICRCTDLRHFIQGTWAWQIWVSAGIWDPPPTTDT